MKQLDLFIHDSDFEKVEYHYSITLRAKENLVLPQWSNYNWMLTYTAENGAPVFISLSDPI